MLPWLAHDCTYHLYKNNGSVRITSISQLVRTLHRNRRAAGSIPVRGPIIALVKPAAHESNLLLKLTSSRGSYHSKFLSCADSFREDLTSRGLEENIYRV